MDSEDGRHQMGRGFSNMATERMERINWMNPRTNVEAFEVRGNNRGLMK